MFTMQETSPMAILIIDDMTSNITVLRDAVDGLAEVFFATSGASGLALARHCRPDVVLLDIAMPGMDGYAVCEALKADPLTADCAVIFVTGYTCADRELLSLQQGGVDYLQKPLDLAVVRARVFNHLRIRMQTRALAQARQDLADVVAHLPAFLSYWDDQHLNRFCNDVAGRWFGVTAASMEGMALPEVVGSANALLIRRRLYVGPPDAAPAFEMSLHNADGGTVHTQASVVRRERGKRDSSFLLLITDVSARKQAELALYDEKERMRIMLNSIGDAVIATDRYGCVTFLNPIAEEMTGWSSEEAVGQLIEHVMPLIDGDSGAVTRNPVRLALSEDRIVGMALDCVLVRRDGRRLMVEDSAAPVRDRNGVQSGAIIVFHDVSEARAMAYKMTHLAQHDALTNLPNRTLLRDRTTQALEQASRQDQHVAMLLIDLDNFKVINSTAGHAVGDTLLQQVSLRLQQALRAGDTICRQGGDEFIILLSALDDVEYAGVVARKLLAVLVEAFMVGNQRFDLSASIGVSLFPGDSNDQDGLYRHADSAMYRAKQEGKNRFCFFSAELEEKLLARHALIGELRKAIEDGGLEMHYQPKVDARVGRVVGLEALIRWRHHGVLVPPASFIALAEECGLIVPLGQFVLHQVCTDLARLVDAQVAVPISINLAGQQFDDLALAADIARTLASHDLPSHLLEVEITEGTLIEDVIHSLENLRTLSELGIRTSIDDFGTGYSSLSYLKKFPIDVLKIDQSFVHDMLTDSSDAAIISAIISLASSLRMDLVAEGVEQQAQADRLLAMGCTIMQGYLYSRPVPFEEMLTLLRHETIFGLPPVPA